MSPELSLDELAELLTGMKPDQAVMLRTGYKILWPRPPFPGPDDYLSDEERAKRWCAAFGCTIRENLDPPGLEITKTKPTGRWASPSEPNIQNIPIRTAAGRAIKNAFTRRKDPE